MGNLRQARSAVAPRYPSCRRGERQGLSWFAAGATLIVGLGLLLAGCAREASLGRPWVHDIRFMGTRNLKPKDIKKRIALSETSWFPFAPKRYFDGAVLESDKRRVRAYYRAHGFFGARVTATEVQPRGEHSVNVVFHVDEGAPSRIRNVAIHGLEDLPEAERKRVTADLWLAPGKLFEHQRYLEDKERIEARLQNGGHPFPKVNGVASVNRDERWVDVELNVVPGAVAFVGGMEVTGDASVKPRTVLDLATVRPGDRFNPEEIERTRGRIYEAGLFTAVKVEPVPRPGQPGVVDLRIVLSPGKKNEVRVGGGVGIEPQRNEVHLRFQYARRNFFGGLRTLRVRLTPGYVWIPNILNRGNEHVGRRHGPAVRSEVTLTQPNFYHRGLTFEATLGYDLGVEYAFRYHGPRFQVGVDQGFLRDRLHVKGAYHIEYLQFFDPTDPEFLTDPVKARVFFGYVNPYRLAYLTGELTWDLRDRPLDPTRGAYFWLQTEVGASWLGGRFNYERVIPDVRGYVPLGNRVRLAMRVQYGQLFSSEAGPITRRLYAGGADSHRGFNYNRLSDYRWPDGTTVASPAPGRQPPLVPIGGKELLLFQGEVRIDVIRLYGSWLGTVVFFDSGDVPEAGRSLSLRHLHHAAGLGLRYRTVIGTIRADVGVRLNRLGVMEADGRHNPDPGSRFAFHLSLGEAF
ncbi:MAG TPA: POTRA domain-containing protein [Polyangia bacterium]|nr:POTRA domain-containing protein [Polyangia bacterium]